MKALIRLALMVAICSAMAFGAGAASLTEQLAGTWTLVSNVAKRPDGSTFDSFGGGQRGILMLDRSGNFSLQIMGNARRKFAANNRLQGSAEENQSVVQGSIAYFGAYTVSEADHLLIFKVDRSSYPNWDGTEQKRQFNLADDELKYSVPTTASGVTAELVWRRAK
jgi:hypothetical protein